jgi:DNA processing protein
MTIRPDAAWYPRRLREACGDRHLLHVRGTVTEPSLAVAIVGARAATAAAMQQAFSLARGLAERGATVISGGATGIDTAAHQGALAAGGATVVVLGCGVDVAYPARNARLFDQIVATGGALVSTYPDGMQPFPGLFVQRNAVIAGLADVVVVVEASATSGSLHTARAAIQIGRAVGACGDSPGTRRLHTAGAAVIARADDVVALAAGEARRAVALAVDERALAVARAIGPDPGASATVDELALRTNLTSRAVACALLDLEAAGWVATRPGGQYVITAIARLAQEC